MFLFYFHIVLTGVAIAAATTYFAAIVGAPAPRIYPVVREEGGLFGPVALWLLSGPIALMRFVVRTHFRHAIPVLFVLFFLINGGADWCSGLGLLPWRYRAGAGVSAVFRPDCSALHLHAS